MFQLDFGLTRHSRPQFQQADFRSKVDVRDIDYLLLARWEEHCLECSAPDCFDSCSLYQKRSDFMCQRFDYGIVANNDFRGLFNYGADMKFRRWGKLEASLVYAPVSYKTITKIARIDSLFLRVVRPLTTITNKINTIRKINPSIVYNTLKKKILKKVNRKPGDKNWDFDEFIVEAVNPGDEEFSLNIEFLQGEDLVYKASVMMQKGCNFFRFPCADMMVDIRALSENGGRIAIYPSDNYQARIIFTWLDFVKYKEGAIAEAAVQMGAANGSKKIKCVVWDLDNTLWDGILIEDGPEGVRLREESVHLIKELDSRGVVQSVASKNDHNAAWELICSYNLDKYFIYPAINWQPKSGNIKEIARELDVHLDTFAFIDDSAFERAEVSQSVPDVRVYPESDVEKLLELPEFDLIATGESRKRRIMYQHEASRKKIASDFGGSHDDFLKSCMLVLEIEPPGNENHIMRCFELVQRTNQLNISGYRYEEDEFRTLLGQENCLSLMLSCSDKFGEYGIVGYISINMGNDMGGPLIRDLVISCRVARKKVEHALFRWIRDYFASGGCEAVYLRFVPTARNNLIMETLLDVGFHVKEEKELEKLLYLDGKMSIPGSDIVRISDKFDRQG